MPHASTRPGGQHPGKLIRVLAVLFAAGLLAAACGDDGSDTSTGDTSAPEDGNGDVGDDEAPSGEPIRIGAVLSVTGPGSSLGEQQQRTLELLAEQHNDGGGIEGHPVELDIRDDESNPDRSVEQVRALIDEFDPHAVLGGSIAATCQATKPVTEEAEVVQYCLSALPITYPAPYYFSAQSPLAAWIGNVPVQWMQEQGFEKIACLASDDSSGQLTVDVVEAAAEGAGIEFVSENFNIDDVDVSAQLTNLRDQDPDVMYACTSGKGVVTVLQGMQQLAIDLPTWVSSGSASLDVAELIADLLPSQGAYTGGEKIQVFEELDADDPQAEKITEFATDYIDTYDQRPDLFAAASADAFEMLTTTVATVGVDASADEIVTHMEDEVEFTGVQLLYDFTAEDHRGTNLSGIVVEFTDEGGFELEAQYDEVTDFAAGGG